LRQEKIIGGALTAYQKPSHFAMDLTKVLALKAKCLRPQKLRPFTFAAANIATTNHFAMEAILAFKEFFTLHVYVFFLRAEKLYIQETY
jgi:hypothetical protein